MEKTIKKDDAKKKRLIEIEKEILILNERLNNCIGTKTEVYTRIVGYYRSVINWNKGKSEEKRLRLPFDLKKVKD